MKTKRPRNHIARAQILSKGGAHGKTRKAERRQAKIKIKKETVS